MNDIPQFHTEEQLDLLAEPCCYCDEPADFLCDAVIGWPAILDEGSDPPHVCIDSSKPAYTCDAPMCGKCKIQSGSTMWICGGGEPCEIITDDYCHIHHERHQLQADIVPLTPVGIQKLREQQRVDRARERLRRQMYGPPLEQEPAKESR